MTAFDNVVVFAATMHRDREVLGERVTAWLHANQEQRVVDIAVLQSSDSSFHCITVVVFSRRA